MSIHGPTRVTCEIHHVLLHACIKNSKPRILEHVVACSANPSSNTCTCTSLFPGLYYSLAPVFMIMFRVCSSFSGEKRIYIRRLVSIISSAGFHLQELKKFLFDTSFNFSTPVE